MKAPNTQLSAAGCQLRLDGDARVPWDRPLVAVLRDVYEAPMQPFPPNADMGSQNGAIAAHHHERHRGGGGGGGGGSGSGDETSPDDVVTSETRGGWLRGSRFFFRPGARFRVRVHVDADRSHPCFELGEQVGSGELVLGPSVFADSEAMNYDPFHKVDKVVEWRHEFDQIGKELDDGPSAS